MDIFISWSEERSRIIAEALRDWLPLMINDVQPWLSSEDIDPGARWNAETVGKLESSEYGIICLTPENIEKPWILFEAGALSKSVKTSRVVPYLHELNPTDLKGPLTQFQAIEANEEDTWKLVGKINSTIENSKGVYLENDALTKAYSVWWPKLEEKLSSIPKSSSPSKPKRADRDILEEILSIVRSEAREKEATSRGLRFETRDLDLDDVIDGLRQEGYSLEKRLTQTSDPAKREFLEAELAKIQLEIKGVRRSQIPQWMIDDEKMDRD